METLDELIKKLPRCIGKKDYFQKYKLTIIPTSNGWVIEYYNDYLNSVFFLTNDENDTVIFGSRSNDFRTAVEDILTKIYQNEDKLELDFVK